MRTDPIGDPIITSKCKRRDDKGFLIASNNGFAWRIKLQMSPYAELYAGKSRWVRWHDVHDITGKRDGVLLITVKKQKKGKLIVDSKGNPKLLNWKMVLKKNKKEDKAHFLQRKAAFYDIMVDLFNQNKGEIDPPTSDSRIM